MLKAEETKPEEPKPETTSEAKPSAPKEPKKPKKNFTVKIPTWLKYTTFGLGSGLTGAYLQSEGFPYVIHSKDEINKMNEELK